MGTHSFNPEVDTMRDSNCRIVPAPGAALVPCLTALVLAAASPLTAGVVDTVVDTTSSGAIVNGSVDPGEYVDTEST